MSGDDNVLIGPDHDARAQRAESSGLLQGRRKFLAGSVGITGAVATLASRPAWAGGGGNWMSASVQLACSVHASHLITPTSCSGYHCDYFACSQANWKNGWFPSQTFSSCGWTPSYSVCGFTDGSLWSYINSCYNYGYNKYTLNSGATYINACWIACGFLNANCNSGAFGYDVPGFAAACNTAFSTPNCSQSSIVTQICTFLKNHCTNGAIGPIPQNPYKNGYTNPYHQSWCWG
jgi:hypothetical protein